MNDARLFSAYLRVAAVLRSLLGVLLASFEKPEASYGAKLAAGALPGHNLGGGGEEEMPYLRLKMRTRRGEAGFLNEELSRGLIQAKEGQVHLGTRDPCRLHATACRAYLLRSMIKLLSSSSSSSLSINLLLPPPPSP